MYTYRLKLGDDQRRIHLRIAEGGHGVLFADVTDVVHLNPTAAQIAKWALDRVPRQTAGAWLQR